jgi:DNA-binding NtrC family response regulator
VASTLKTQQRNSSPRPVSPSSGDESGFEEDDFEGPTRIREQYLIEPTKFGQMVGRSAPMRTLFSLLERAAASDATVLVEGETGTGKEATAEAIHHEGPRKDGPFVVIDCGAIPHELLESELFGHERGSFTGAVAARQGAFEAASGGTIFLDEIGELSLDLQPKILRVLERRQVKRVGSTAYGNVDVRVIAATNRSLRAEVTAQRFRSDLYYRLAVVQVKLPPLRERIADLPILVDHVITALGAGERTIARSLRSHEFLDRLTRYRWPGNVRQLRNYIERCIALDDSTIDITKPLRMAREQCVNHFERRYLEAILLKHNNNVSAAARSAEVDRIHFYRLLWKHGLRAHTPEKSVPNAEE